LDVYRTAEAICGPGNPLLAPLGIAEESAMVFLEKRLDRFSAQTQLKRIAVSRVTHRVIGPGEDDPFQGFEGRLKIPARQGPARPARKDGIANQYPMIVYFPLLPSGSYCP
jgi:hypothetical protein